MGVPSFCRVIEEMIYCAAICRTAALFDGYRSNAVDVVYIQRPPNRWIFLLYCLVHPCGSLTNYTFLINFYLAGTPSSGCTPAINNPSFSGVAFARGTMSMI